MPKLPIRTSLINNGQAGLSTSMQEGLQFMAEEFILCPNCGECSKNIKVCEYCKCSFSYTHNPFKQQQCPKDTEKRRPCCMPPEASPVPQLKPSYAPQTPPKAPTENTFPDTVTKGIILKKVQIPHRHIKSEPECLVISSDEESEDDDGTGSSCSNMSTNQVMNTSLEKAYNITKDIQNNKPIINRQTPVKRKRSEVSNSEARYNDDSQMTFACRSIRVGSYKIVQTIMVTVSLKGFQFSVPPVTNENDVISLDLKPSDIVKVLAHFSRSLTVFYLYTSPNCGNFIRSKLEMTKGSHMYYDPAGADEREKRITLLPEKRFEEDEKNFFRAVFPGSLLEEIDQKMANEILIRSAPIQTSSSPQQMIMLSKVFIQSPSCLQGSPTVVQSVAVRSPQCVSFNNQPTQVVVSPAPPEPIVKLLVYPPPPQTGGISINNADLLCLEEEEFLSDVIIDFYLKYLITERASESVRQRTHVFSSFFYSRLTQKLAIQRTPDGKPEMSPQEKRHSHVRTWTRHVDIFQKDYIIVPINQNSHWFVAVICFPGLVVKKYPPKCLQTDCSQNTGFQSTENSNTNCKPLQEQGEQTAETAEASNGVNKTENQTPSYPDSYILIFDSLLTQESRWPIIGFLRDYLTEEWHSKMKSAVTFNYDNMRGYIPKVPQQGNFSDCGIYLLQYIESFLENPPPSGKPPLDLREWFPVEKVKRKRTEIQDLILDLHLKQQPDSDFVKKLKESKSQMDEQVEESPSGVVNS